jgi:hypothetical protein
MIGTDQVMVPCVLASGVLRKRWSLRLHAKVPMDVVRVGEDERGMLSIW